MKGLYFGISDYSEDNFMKGVQIVQEAIEDGYEDKIMEFRAKEITLTETGFAPNSFKLLVYGDAKQCQDFLLLVSQKFDELLCESYEVENVQDVDFDDEDFKEEFEKLFQFLNEEVKGTIKPVGRGFYFIDA